MDTIKIGRFIAESRKIQSLTQLQLADELCISDKTISKWECGKGLPDASLMLPLCDKLKISVNDLLSGERVTISDYQKKAEENMMSLMKENEENKRLFSVSVICGVISIIATCALILLVAFVLMPTILKILIIILAVATAVIGIGGAVTLDIKAGYFECPYCKELFIPTTSEYVKGRHTFTKRMLTCPKCGKSGMCKKRITQ